MFKMVDKLAPDSRHSVKLGDRVVYQWSQTVSDVDIYAPLPENTKVTAKMLFVNIGRSELDFGIVGTDPYMKVRTSNQAHGTASDKQGRGCERDTVLSTQLVRCDAQPAYDGFFKF